MGLRSVGICGPDNNYTQKYIHNFKTVIGEYPQYHILDYDKNQNGLTGKVSTSQGLVKVEYIFEITPTNSYGASSAKNANCPRFTARSIIEPAHLFLSPFSLAEKANIDIIAIGQKIFEPIRQEVYQKTVESL
jgi:hypothetical protein